MLVGGGASRSPAAHCAPSRSPPGDSRYPDAAVRLQDPEQLVAAAWQVNGSRAELALEVQANVRPPRVRASEHARSELSPPAAIRRFRRAAAAAASGLTAGALAVLAAGADAPRVSAVLLLTTIGLLIYARHWLVLAGRSRLGARSEDEVQRELAPLQPEGWRLRHSLPWRGRGDIDSVAIAPTGIAVGIETKDQDLRRTSPRARAGAGGMAVPTQAMVVPPRRCGGSVSRPSRGVQRLEHDVLVVSIDRLTAALRTAAGARARPPFLSGSPLATAGESSRALDAAGR
jgi:hypothetical protein